MSAALKPHSVDSAMEAALAYMEEQEVRLKGYKLAIQRLEAELLTAQMEASLEIAKAKFEAAQVGEAHRRIAALEKESDRLNNFVTGHCVQRDQEYENLRSNVSYLMGAHAP